MRHDHGHLAEFHRGLAGYQSARHLPAAREYYREIVHRSIDAMRAAAWAEARREGRPSTHRPPSWAYTLREVA